MILTFLLIAVGLSVLILIADLQECAADSPT